MHDIICPHCSKAFKVGEADYSEILKQVRDSDFTEQYHERLELAEREKTAAVELASIKVASDKDAVIQEGAVPDNSEKGLSWDLCARAV